MFSFQSLEKVVITVRSPLNAEQKISTLESLVKNEKNIRKMVIRILHMKSSHISTNDFFRRFGGLFPGTTRLLK